MILVRDVFQAKYGQGGDLVALFKEVKEKWPESAQYGYRILTDTTKDWRFRKERGWSRQ